jgi:hypothetical protein
MGILFLASPIVGPMYGYQIDGALQDGAPGQQAAIEEGAPSQGSHTLTIDKKRSPMTDDAGTSITASITVKVWTKDAAGDWLILNTNTSASSDVAITLTMLKQYGGWVWVEIDSCTNVYVDVVNTGDANPNLVETIFEDIDGDGSKEHAFKMFLEEEFGDEVESTRFTLYGVQQAQTIGDANPANEIGAGESANDTWVKWKLSMDTETYGIAIKKIYVETNQTDESDVYPRAADFWFGTLTDFEEDHMATKIRYYIFDSTDPSDAKWAVWEKNSANEFQSYVQLRTNLETNETIQATLYVVYWEEGYIEETTISDAMTIAEHVG